VSAEHATHDGEHLSIGEVLTELQAEFPDVTISKIRFLESQGLINPERTPSGYRKFSPADVARLRWILVEQRDHFLPLKVIKERLDAHDLSTGPLPPPSAPPSEPAREPPPGAPRSAHREASLSTSRRDEREQSREQPRRPQRADEAGEAEVVTIRRRARDLTLPLVLDGEPAPDDDEGPDTFDRVALARAADVTEAMLDELESYGVIRPFHDDGIRAFYDRDALVCVRAAATLARHGLQPRHLKMYVHFTEREAALFHQVLAPYLRQRNPVSRARVDSTLSDLVTEARALRGALLRRAIEDALGD
jgi:DNA-binding transcriptional MerR regulator